jgi:LssY-like putative type I secretion system component LssY
MVGARDCERSVLATLDSLLFVFAAFAAIWLAYLLLLASLEPNWQILLLAVFWALVAYLVLPRLHRILTAVYLPGYFIGRARTSDGLLGDPVNLALLGTEAQIHAAMTRAGWTRADDVDLASSMRIIRTTVSRTSYAEAPVSPLHLFDRTQDFAYQQEVAGNPAKRHHVRFWACPEGWRLPGGHVADWVAAGTYDRAVGLSLMTLQVTHRIAPDIDAERDYTVSALLEANPTVTVDLIRHFSSGYHSRNGGGDAIVTDGDLPVVDVRTLHADATAAVIEPTSGRERPPAPTVFGAGVAFLRGLYALIGVLAIVRAPDAAGPFLSADRADVEASSSAITAAVLAVSAVLDVGLGLATFRGRNWARILLMLFSVVEIVGAFVAEAAGGPRPTLGAGLPAVALGILVLLALTSHRSRDYATRGKASGEPVVGPQPPASAQVDGAPTASGLPHQRRGATSDETPTSPGRRARRN